MTRDVIIAAGSLLGTIALAYAFIRRAPQRNTLIVGGVGIGLLSAAVIVLNLFTGLPRIVSNIISTLFGVITLIGVVALCVAVLVGIFLLTHFLLGKLSRVFFARMFLGATPPPKSLIVVGSASGGLVAAILTVIAIPAYQDYLPRARFTEEINQAQADKSATQLVAEQGTRAAWNAWVEEGAADLSCAPISDVSPGGRARLVLDLAAVPYLFQGVTSESITADEIATIEAAGGEAVIDVLVVPSSKYFWPLPDDERVSKIKIQVARLKEALSRDWKSYGDPFEYMRGHACQAPFSLGRSVFNLRTRKISNAAIAGISLLFFVEDGGKGVLPVGSMALSVCIGDGHPHCPAELAQAATFNGPSQIRIEQQLGKNRGYPYAALTVAELDNHSAVGVFRCNRCPTWRADQFETWNIGMPVQKLATQLEELLTDFEKADKYRDQEAFHKTGQSMFNLIFGANIEARQTFSQWFATLPQYEPNTHTRPTLFVRLVSPGYVEPFAIPLGLMGVPIQDGKIKFLGSAVEVQTPLEFEDYTSGSTCLNKWVLFVPPPDIDKQDVQLPFARVEFSDWIDIFNASPNKNAIYDDVTAFLSWISKPEATEPVALLILSHHDSDSLYFNDDKKLPNVRSADLLRKFAAPSLAVVDACGAAKPGAFEVVRELNRVGKVGTVIASSTLVDKTMGGRYLKLLMDNLQRANGDNNYTIGDANFDAVTFLSDESRKGEDGKETGEKFGSAALMFSVLGNSNLRVCAPTQASQSGERSNGLGVRGRSGVPEPR